MDELLALQSLLYDQDTMRTYPKTAAALAPLRDLDGLAVSDRCEAIDTADATAVAIKGELCCGLVVYSYVRPAVLRLLRQEHYRAAMEKRNNG